MKKFDLITPEGTRDLLFDESVARRTVEDKLQTLFKKYGLQDLPPQGLKTRLFL